MALPALWHLANPEPLRKARSVTDCTPQHLRALGEFMLPGLPSHLLASENIRSDVAYRSSRHMPLHAAIMRPWVTLDTGDYINAIKIDVDDSDAVDRAMAVARDYRLPLIIVADPWSGFAHVVLRLTVPVRRNNEKAMRLYEYAGRLIAEALGGHLMPPRALIKSPWGRKAKCEGQLRRRTSRPVYPLLWDAYQAANTGLVWHTYVTELRTVSLRDDVVDALADEFGDRVKKRTGWQRRVTLPDHWPGRNCELFDRLRWWAMDHTVRDRMAIRDKATEINDTQFPQRPMQRSEVKATAHSVWRFMRRYKGRREQGRDAALGIRLTAADRQVLAAKRTAKFLKAGTDKKIAQGLQALRAAGSKLTQAALALASKVSLSTIKRRWASLTGRCQTLPQSEVGTPKGPTIFANLASPTLLLATGHRADNATTTLDAPETATGPPDGGVTPRQKPARYSMNCEFAPADCHDCDLPDAPAYTVNGGFKLLPRWWPELGGWFKTWTETVSF